MTRTHHGNGFRCGDIWTWIWQANDDERPKGTTRSPVGWRTGEDPRAFGFGRPTGDDLGALN